MLQSGILNQDTFYLGYLCICTFIYLHIDFFIEAFYVFICIFIYLVRFSLLLYANLVGGSELSLRGFVGCRTARATRQKES